MQQLITPDPNTACDPGMCLQYVRLSYGLPARYYSATEAWEKSTSKHEDQNFPPGLWVPIWFSIDIEPLGHVANRAPDGSVYSSSDLGHTPHHHASIDDLINYYAYYGKMQLTYLGWTEDVASYPVVGGPDITDQSGTVTPIQETEVITPEDITAISEAITWAPRPKYHVDGTPNGTTTLGETIAWNEANFTRQRQLTIDSIKEIVTGVLTTELTNVATGGTTSLGTEASWNAWNAQQARQAAGTAAAPQIDPAAIADQISKAIAARLNADPVPTKGN